MYRGVYDYFFLFISHVFSPLFGLVYASLSIPLLLPMSSSLSAYLVLLIICTGARSPLCSCYARTAKCYLARSLFYIAYY